MPIGRDHPKRQPLLEELRARQAPRLLAPTTVIHLALKRPVDAARRDRAADLRQLEALSGEPPGTVATSARHHDFTRGTTTITWESHAEYTSYTAIAPRATTAVTTAVTTGDTAAATSATAIAADPEPCDHFSTDPSRTAFSADPADVFPRAWEDADPAARIAAVILEVLPMPTGPGAAEAVIAQVGIWLDPSQMIVMHVQGEGGVLAGDWRPDEHGFTRFVLFVRPDIGPGRIGRTVQRVLDLETYRALAMIGFLRTQELSARLNALDPQLLELVAHLDSSDRPAEDVLDELLSVTAELEALATQSDFRFGATGAYAAIVDDRLTSLGNARFLGRQTIREFLSRRYVPAIRTVEATESRLHRMLDRASRAGNLLRTKVDVQRAAQNQALLHGMDARAETQLRLQHTVEGLSVVAISYYAIGLLAYVLAPIVEAAGIEKKWLMAALVPVVLLVAWLGMRWVRRRIHRQH